MKAVETYIGMGSNLGDGPSILNQAWERLGEFEGIRLIALSGLYRTAPVDMESDNWFTNGVGKIQTDLSPSAMLETLLQTEAVFGRTRDAKSSGYQDRALDLDLLYYGDTIINTPDLVLPHPRIGDRLFVLIPLMALAPDHRDPVSGATIRSMEKQLNNRIKDSTSQHQEIIPGDSMK